MKTTTLAVAAFGDTTILIAIGLVLGSAVTMAIHNMTCELQDWRTRRAARRRTVTR